VPPGSIAATWSVPAESAQAPDAADAQEGDAEPDAAPEPLGVEEVLRGSGRALWDGDPRAALDALAALPEAEEGSPSWFLVGIVRGRAQHLLGEHERAVTFLEPRVEHRKLGRHVPPEVIGLELARAKLAWANQPGTAPERADELRREAAKLLGGMMKKRPIRILAALRVERARALAAVEGSERKSRFWAAKRALRALDRVTADFPNHPHVGELRLLRAKMLARTGKHATAAAELRKIAIERTGEPEAEAAFAELQLLAEERPRRIRVRPWSTKEKLERAVWARRLRRVKASRALLDEVLADPDVPKYMRRQARRSRARTAYRQRDYATCASDLRQLYERTGSYEVRDQLLRCLRRARQYDEAIQIWLQRAEKKKGGLRAAAIWRALKLSVIAGQYQRASDLLERYEKMTRGHHGERRWLNAWLPYRLGRHDEAVAGLEILERRSSEHKKMARYFRGKILLAAEDEEKQSLGEDLLKSIIAADPLAYYGLQARQRLHEGGRDPGPVPKLRPMADEDQRPDYGEARELFEALDDKFGQAWPGLRRAGQLHAVGHRDGAQRELRVVIDSYLHGAQRRGGRRVMVPRSEAILVGLGWKSDWQYPKVYPTREGRKTLRGKESSAELRDGLRRLAHALDEPHRYARLTRSTDYPRRSRWHPRAFRTVIEREAKRRKVDPMHLWALMYTESRFRRFVVSPVGARGALQIMPWTGRQLAERLGELDGGRFDHDRLYDIDTNARLSAYYVAELLHKFHGQAAMAYASYNGGPSNVARWLTAKAGGPERLQLDVFIEEIEFRETYRYTKRVLEVEAAYELIYRGKLPRWTNDVDPVAEDNIDF
jgi:hypothetical protein